MSVLGNITPEQFLAEYWQQKPLVVRGAFADLDVPFTPEELAGLAIDTDAPSRIIVEHGLPPENSPWQAKHSPFSDEDFTSLPDTHWTFLINDLERYVPELGNLMEPFRFIPDWRIDDLMVSYAADQGSVGPHRDDYDVFLIQGMGKRRWKIINHDHYPRATIPDLSLSLLAEFEADQEWVLEQGDMLYLPPNMPHYGIAEGECMTFSVGFRAPSKQELIQGWVESFTDRPEFKQRFSDQRRKLQSSSGEIRSEDLKNLSEMIIESLQSQQPHLESWLGKYLTETRGEVEQADEAVTTAAITSLASSDFERESWLRFAYYINPKQRDTIHFFADGKQISLPISDQKNIETLCSDYYYSADFLSELLKNKEFKALFELLVSEGGLYPATE